MNTDGLEKLYKEAMNDTAPDFWDRIDKGLKLHAELSEEEKNAFAEFETVPAEADGKTSAESAENRKNIEQKNRKQETKEQENREQETKAPENGDTKGKKPHKILRFRRPDRISTGGWIAAAVIIAVFIPSALFFAKRATFSSATNLAAATAAAEEAMDAAAQTFAAAEAATEASTEAATTAASKTGTAIAAAEAAGVTPEADTAAAAQADADKTAGTTQAETEAVIIAAAEAPREAEETSAIRLLSVPDGAVTVPAEAEFFTEDVLAETDMLAIVSIDKATFKSDPNGHIYRLVYSGTVNGSLLDDGESGRTGSELRILSPIVSDGTPGGRILYQLIPGQTYILPLKKTGGDWYLVCPYAPQIEMHDDGSFEFHTGYTSLINDDTEVVFGEQASDDDFWFDRKISRSDEEFIEELTELVQFEKKKAGVQ